MSDAWIRAKGGTYPMRRVEPPEASFFRSPRPAAGAETMALELGALRLEFEGLDGPLAESLRERYAPYAGDGSPRDGGLRVRLGLEDRDYFIEPAEGLEFNPVGIACDGPRIRYAGYRVAGWFDAAGPSGLMLLARGDREPALRAIENYVRAAVAWRAAALGGALVHAASAVRHGRGYLFFGESGAGKSTLAASNRRGTIVSDDLSLVLPGDDGRLELVGSPFRGTWEGGAPVVGRYPLAAGFRLVKAVEARVEPAPRVVVFGQLVGNLTFLAEAFDTRPDLFTSVERAFAPVPLARLHFRKDDTFWDAIDAAELRASP